MKKLFYFLFIFTPFLSDGQNCIPNQLITFPDLGIDYMASNLDSTASDSGKTYSFEAFVAFDSGYIHNFINTLPEEIILVGGTRSHWHVTYTTGGATITCKCSPSSQTCFGYSNSPVNFKTIVGVNVNNINFTNSNNVTHGNNTNINNPDTLAYFTCDSTTTETFDSAGVEGTELLMSDVSPINNNTMPLAPFKGGPINIVAGAIYSVHPQGDSYYWTIMCSWGGTVCVFYYSPVTAPINPEEIYGDF